MAQLQSNFDFTGKLGNVSAYKRRDTDKIIHRTKGGPTRNQFKTHANFKMARRNSAEFGGRATGCKMIRRMLHPLLELADYISAGPIIALIKPIQALDTAHDLGERDILFSKDSSLLNGFNLNRRIIFDSIIRNPLSYSIDRTTLTGTIEIPQLIPSINFFNPGKHAFYSIVGAIGVIPDLLYSKDGYQCAWGNDEPWGSIHGASEWFSSLEGSKPFNIIVQYNIAVPDQLFAAIFSVGIKFGTMGIGGAIQQVPYAGAAKILVTA
jgi:hypothetical protein